MSETRINMEGASDLQKTCQEKDHVRTKSRGRWGTMQSGTTDCERLGHVMSCLAALAAAPRLPVTHTLCSAGASQT